MTMRRLAIAGTLALGLLAGCTSPTPRADDGWAMLVAQDYAGARAYYEQAVAANPDDPYVHLNLGVAYEKLGDKERAAQHYRVALANGQEAEITEVAEDGRVAARRTTVARLAEENLAGLGS